MLEDTSAPIRHSIFAQACFSHGRVGHDESGGRIAAVGHEDRAVPLAVEGAGCLALLQVLEDLNALFGREVAVGPQEIPALGQAGVGHEHGVAVASNLDGAAGVQEGAGHRAVVRHGCDGDHLTAFVGVDADVAAGQHLNVDDQLCAGQEARVGAPGATVGGLHADLHDRSALRVLGRGEVGVEGEDRDQGRGDDLPVHGVYLHSVRHGKF